MTSGGQRSREEILAAILAIYREVLDKEAVAVSDNFYDIGGNSLLGLRVIKRAAEMLGVRLSAKAVFGAASIGEVAEHAVAQTRQEPRPAAASGGGIHRGRASMAQEWAVLSEVDDPDAPPLQFHVAYRIRGELDPEVLRGALRALVDTHAALRTVLTVRGKTVVQEIRTEAEPELLVRDVTWAGDTERAALSELDRQLLRRFDRTNAPAMRAVLVRCGAEDHYLGLAFDHAAADGWSLDIITADLGAAYDALAAGRSPALTRPAAYADWAAQQWENCENGRLDVVADYWRGQLGDDPSAFALRLPGYRPNQGLADPAAVVRPVPAPTAEALEKLSHELRTTAYCVSLAALKTLIANRTGLSRVTVLSTSANRLEPAYQGTVGWFANGVFPTTDIDTGRTFREIVEDVRATVLAATEHGDLPAAYVRKRMWPATGNGFRKDPGVYFMQNDLWGAALRLGNTSVAPVQLPEHADSPGLHLWLLRNGKEMVLQALHYRSEYPSEYVDRFLSEFLMTIELMAGQPGHPVSELLTVMTPNNGK